MHKEATYRLVLPPCSARECAGRGALAPFAPPPPHSLQREGRESLRAKGYSLEKELSILDVTVVEIVPISCYVEKRASIVPFSKMALSEFKDIF
ncbi:unnamed protein product, partial [Iphiclides podalirius]